MENTNNELTKLSYLTSIEEKDLTRLIEILESIIIDDTIEDIAQEKDTTYVDIGLGQLSIFHSNDTLKFKFTPNAKFEEGLINACIHDVNQLDTKIEQSLKDRITNTYKDLL